MSISTITGENGIVAKAKDAAEKTKDAEKEEQAALDIFDEYINDNSPYDHNAPELHPIGMIPEGAVYTKADGTVLNAGEAFPAEMIAGDRYKFGDYEYGYLVTYLDLPPIVGWFPIGSGCESKGWFACTVDKTKSEYGPILESINEEPVNVISTFMGCINLTKAPVLPEGNIELTSTFGNCSSLTVAPEIPDSVTDMEGTFADCTSLTEVPAIPDSVTIMKGTFSGCTSLTKAPEIPDSVEDLYGIFNECKKLKTYQGSTDPDGDFSNYKIPNNVKKMGYAFSYCENLTKSPAIPDSVTEMERTFDGCIKLTGEISIPCSLVSKNYTYNDCPATVTYYHVDSCDGSCGQ